MNTKVMEMLRNAGARLLVFALVVVGSGMPSSVAEAATTSGIANEVTYQEVKYVDCKTYITKSEAPEYTAVSGVDDSFGYLFAGWFTAKNDSSANKITAATTGIADDTTVYAKFVPAYVMSVKCQNWSDTKEDSTSTKIRLLSSLDSAMYSEFGFRVEKLMANEDGSYTETLIGEKAVSKIYEGGIDIYSGANKTTYSTDKVFGAKSVYAASLTLTGVTDFVAIYSIQPYWVTFDGTKVYGLARNAHVEDGLYGYINVPVNLKSVDDVAAGILSVDCSALPSGYKLKNVERGAAFQEMSYSDKGNNVIKCAGNVADISSNVESNDLFVNLRFAPSGDKATRTYDGKFYHFGISGVEFCDNKETEPEDYKVWNIQY